VKEGAAVKNRSDVSQYEHVTTRLLAEAERPYPAGESGTPLVIEAASSSDLTFLKGFLSAHAQRIRNDLYNHGAVLLRGFEVRSARDFEAVLSALQGFRPMSDYFMSEMGRDPVKGTTCVFETNALIKTGGEFRFGKVHSENYYSLDVPHFQCFCCLKTPWLGGETGLFHVANAYGELRERFVAKLEKEPFVANAIPTSSVAARYGLPEPDVERFLEENDVTVADVNGGKVLLNYKPSVFRHPHTGKFSLQVNISEELKGLEIERHFLPYYTGGKWAVHRLAWRRRRVLQALFYLVHIPHAIRHPAIIRELFAPLWRRLLAPSPQPKQQHGPTVTPTWPRLGQRLDQEDAKLLGTAVWKHSSVFTWRRGDVLLIDNLQVHHAGMPGFGPRDIKVIMGNPVPLGHANGAGLLNVKMDDGYRSVDDRLREFARRSQSSSATA
jgi:alpha-ketoglutarate-dependent taurine dioxygenase